MFSATVATKQTETPFDGVPSRQLEACALWFYGDGRGPMSEREIADALGCSQQNAHKLISKGTARIRANGYTPTRATVARALGPS